MIESDGVLSKISKIQSNKEDVRQAIVERNITLNETALLSEYDEAVKLIKTNSESDIYKCFSVDVENGTWSGYKGKILGDECVFSKDLTDELKIYKMKPIPGYVYNSDASFRFDAIYVDGRKNDVFIFRTFESAVEDELKGGVAPTLWGNGTDTAFGEDVPSSNLPCLQSDNNIVTYKVPDLFSSSCFTVSFWVKIKDDASENLTGVAFGKGNTDSTITGIGVTVKNDGEAGFNNECYLGESISSETKEHLSTSINEDEHRILVLDRRYWNHYAFVYDGRIGVGRIYINGVCYKDWDGNKDFIIDNVQLDDNQVFYACANGARIAELIVSNSAFNEKQIKWLAWHSDTAKSVSRVYPKLMIEDVQHTVHIGETFEGSIGGTKGTYLNFETFSRGWSGTVNTNEETIPSWMKDDFNPQIYDNANSGNYYSSTASEFGSWEITGSCTVPTPYWFNETYYDGIEELTSDFKINIDVILGTLRIEFPEVEGGINSVAIGDNDGSASEAWNGTASISLKNNVVSTTNHGLNNTTYSFGPMKITVDGSEVIETTNTTDTATLPERVGYLFNFTSNRSEHTEFEDGGESINFTYVDELGITQIVFVKKPFVFGFSYYKPDSCVMILDVKYVSDNEYFAISDNKIEWVGNEEKTQFISTVKHKSKENNSYNFPQKIMPLRILMVDSGGSPTVKLTQNQSLQGDYQVVIKGLGTLRAKIHILYKEI